MMADTHASWRGAAPCSAVAVQSEGVLIRIQVVDSRSLCESLHNKAKDAASPASPTSMDVSRRALQVSCTLETCGQRFWHGCSHVRRERGSWCGWRTSTARGCGPG